MIPFPPEIIHNIFFRLPVKSLIKCTSVCKTWKSMIINQSFIHSHLSRTVHFSNEIDNHLLLFHSVSGSETSSVQEVYSVHYDNQAFDEYSKIESPIIPKEKLCNSHLRMVGTCNGLVCLADDIFFYGYSFFIWNPAIRKLVTLPRPGVTFRTHGGYDASIGFGFDAVTNDYKVVRLVTLVAEDETPTLAEVYSLATGSWRSLGFVAPVCRIARAVSQAFVNGALHWPAVQRINGCFCYFILTFDLGSELFRETLMPKNFEWSLALVFHLSVSGDGKSIALFTMDKRCKDSFLDVWVMKEYGIKESWTKLITLGQQGPETLSPRPLSFRTSGEILLMFYGPKEQYGFDSNGRITVRKNSM